MEKQKKKSNSILEIVGFCTLTIVGFVLLPPFLDKLSTKLYKRSSKNKETNIDEMGPEIVPNNSKEKES